MNTNSVRDQLLRNFEKKQYRDAFVSEHLTTNIAAQIFALREHRNWTQSELTKRTKMAQARISVLENGNYEKFSLNTLKRLASAFDVALIVRFVSFGELLDWVSNLSPEALTVPSFSEDPRCQVSPQPETVTEPTRVFLQGQRSGQAAERSFEYTEKPFERMLAGRRQLPASGGIYAGLSYSPGEALRVSAR